MKGIGPAPRVLIVAESASAKYGGEAILPLLCFRKLRERGVEAWMVVHERTRAELEELMPEQAGRISYVPDLWFHKLVWRLSRFLPARVSYFTIGYLGRLSAQIIARRMARRIVAEHGVDVVHQPVPVSPREPSIMHGLGAPVVMGPMNGGMDYPPAFEKRDRKLRAVGAITNLGRGASTLMNRLMPGKLRAATLMVANERTHRALPRGVKGRVVELVENGVDLAVWSAGPDHPRAPGPVRFAFVGRLVDWKAVDLLIEAFAKVAATTPATLQILGDGPMRGEWEAKVRAAKLSDAIRFAGWRPQVECSRELQASDVLVLPSLYECGGAVVLEAMACGLPVVATNWGGPADYLDPSCGFLVDPVSREGFVAGLADAMIRLALDPGLRAEMGRVAREKVLTGVFNWDHKIDRILEIYGETLGRPAATATGRPAPASIGGVSG